MQSRNNTLWRWQSPSAKLARGSGSTNVIGLSVIKQEAGPRWEKMRESVCARLETMLRQRLGPSDFFIPIDDASYLVVMPAATPEEGQISCLRISYDLHTSLLGSCGVEHLEIAHASNLSDDILELSPLSRFEVVQLAEKADLVLAPPGSSTLDGSGIALPGTPTHQKYALPSDIDLFFHPIWDAQYQVIRAYRCVLHRRYLGSVTLGLAEEARELSQITLGTLERVSDLLNKHLARNERFMVNMPVSYAALSSPTARMEFTAACRRLSCDLRPYLIFKIEGLPVGASQSRLVDFVTTMLPFCRAVIAKVPWKERKLDLYRGIGLKALGVSLDGVRDPASAIERVCREATRGHMLAFLDDVPDARVLRAGLGAGAKWLSGPAIMAPVAEPGPLVHLDLHALLNVAA